MSLAEEIGPVEYIIVEFPGNRFNGEIIPSLEDLVRRGVVHIIDLAVIHKDANGQVTFVEFDQLDEEEAELFDVLDFDINGMLSDEDIQAAGAAMEPNSSAALLVWENTWAAEFARAVRNAHGRVIENDRIPHAVVKAALEYVEDALAQQ